MRRPTIEPNLHILYLAFVDCLGLVLQETYIQTNAVSLGTSPLNHFTGGYGLKNVGYWLGGQTLARDKYVSDTELPRDKYVSDTELPVMEIFLEAAHM